MFLTKHNANCCKSCCGALSQIHGGHTGEVNVTRADNSLLHFVMLKFNRGVALGNAVT